MTYKEALRSIASGVLPCRKCGKPHPWRCANSAHPPVFHRDHHCVVVTCKMGGTYEAESDHHPWERMTPEEFARSVLNV